jgi:hypothetical protein
MGRMLTIKDIQRRASVADDRFRSALAIAASRWDELVFLEDPGAPLPGQRSSWSARDIAEHALSIDRINTGVAARTARESETVDLFKHMRSLANFDWGNRSLGELAFESAQQAGDELTARTAERDALVSTLGPRHLDLATGMSPFALQYMEDRGVPVSNTLAGLLMFCSEHLLDHAEQIEATLRQDGPRIVSR